MSSEDKVLEETSVQLVESILADPDVKPEDVEDEFVKSLINTQQRQKTPSPLPNTHEPIFGDEEPIIETKIESKHTTPEPHETKNEDVHEGNQLEMTNSEHQIEQGEQVHQAVEEKHEESPVAHHEEVEVKHENEIALEQNAEQANEKPEETINREDSPTIEEVIASRFEPEVPLETDIKQIEEFGDHSVEETVKHEESPVEESAEPEIVQSGEQETVPTHEGSPAVVETVSPVEETVPEPINSQDSPMVHSELKPELDFDAKDEQTLSEEMTTNASNVALAPESLAQDQAPILDDEELSIEEEAPSVYSSQLHAEPSNEPKTEEVWTAEVVDGKPATQESACVSELADKFKAVTVSPPSESAQEPLEKQKVTIDAPASTSNDDGNTSVSSSKKAKQSEGLVKRARKYCAII